MKIACTCGHLDQVHSVEQVGKCNMPGCHCLKLVDKKVKSFDSMIGRLDRLLSEFLIAAKSDLDDADRQTIKHHADDLIGVGHAAIDAIKKD